MRNEELLGKKVLVIGSGLSGVGSVRLLHQVGAVTVLLDENKKITTLDIRQKLHEEDRADTEIVQ